MNNIKKAILLILLFNVRIFSQVNEIKKEIEVQFPNSIKEKKEETIIIQSDNPVNKPNSIFIPFPKDETEKIKLKEIEFIELQKKENEPKAGNTSLPLEKVIVLPVIDSTKSVLEEKKVDSKEIISSNPKESKKENLPLIKEVESDLKKTLTENKSKDSKSAKDVRASSKLFINKDSEIKPKENDSKKVSLPNQDAKNKSKKVVKDDDSIPPYERSKYQTNRNDLQAAIPDLSSAANSSGVMSNSAKIDQIRLFAIDRKKQEASSLIESIDDPIYKYKGLYEFAIGLENSAKNNKKLKEESIPYFLKIITESPKDNPVLPKSLWAISHLHYTLGEHTQSLDHLSNLILNHKNSEFIDDAVYLSARIYEESNSVRNLNRAKKYYSMFMQNIDKANFKNSLYLPFVKSRIESLGIE